MKKLFIILLFSGALIACKKSAKDPALPPAPPPNIPPVVSTAKTNFYVDGRSLKDSAGKSFVMRGMNFPVFWFSSDYKPSLHAASSLGCNAARLVWQTTKQSFDPSLTVLDEAIAECLKEKMLPIIELHDFTGGNSASDISTAASWFANAEVKAVLNKYSHAIIINIANEWGSGTVNATTWKNAYLPAITVLRNAGYLVPIMIDAPGYGQNETAIVEAGTELLSSDPIKNIVFSTHAYSNWNSSSTYPSRVAAIQNKNLCFIFGEFGWLVPDDQQPADFNCKVDASKLMQVCQENGVGYLGWSWKGNNAANACFDICKSWSDTSQLTSWGRQWAYDANGVKNTAARASIF